MHLVERGKLDYSVLSHQPNATCLGLDEVSDTYENLKSNKPVQCLAEKDMAITHIRLYDKLVKNC